MIGFTNVAPPALIRGPDFEQPEHPTAKGSASATRPRERERHGMSRLRVTRKGCGQGIGAPRVNNQPEREGFVKRQRAVTRALVRKPVKPCELEQISWTRPENP